MEDLLRQKLPGLSKKKFTVAQHESVLLKEGFLFVVVTEQLEKLEKKQASLVPEAPRQFLHDRGFVGGHHEPTPTRHLVAVNETTGDVVPLGEFGRAWNFEHTPTADEVFQLKGFWDPSVRDIPRHFVHDEYHSPKEIPAPEIVDGVLKYAVYSFSNNSGSHYNDGEIRLPRNESEGLRF